jgi:hypothetical protein
MLNRIDLRASARARLVDSILQDAQAGDCETAKARDEARRDAQKKEGEQ